jgi:lipooligosaccharide transport system permease protein
MSAMMVASFEALYSAFARMHVQRTWESILHAPLVLDDVLLAEWLWAASKSVLSATAILAVIIALDISRAPTLILILPLSGLIGLCFGAIGLCWTLLARSYDFFTYFFTVMTPMIFISGVYFPQDKIPDWLALIGKLLPLASAVALARPLVLGRMPEHLLVPLLILLAYTLTGYWLAVVLARRRFAA